MGDCRLKLIIRDRIILLLKYGPMSTLEIQKAIPDKNARILGATVSNNKSIFLRLERSLVGLRNRDEHLVTGRRIHNDKFSLYKKIYNILVNKECTLEEIYRHLPAEKKVSIRASISMQPNLFIRLAPGVIGRKGRDEHLKPKYVKKKKSKLTYNKKTIADKIESLLTKRPMTLKEICNMLRKYNAKSISSKLSLYTNFVRLPTGYWTLAQYIRDLDIKDDLVVINII